MNREFWIDTAERSLYTMAEAAVGVIGACTAIDQVNWKLVVYASVGAGIATILKCIVVWGRKKYDK